MNNRIGHWPIQIGQSNDGYPSLHCLFGCQTAIFRDFGSIMLMSPKNKAPPPSPTEKNNIKTFIFKTCGKMSHRIIKHV